MSRAMPAQTTLWHDPLPTCWLCEAQLPRHSHTVCLSCRNRIYANAAHVLDMRELLEHVRGWPGQPITMDDWARLIRGGKVDTLEATRRSWLRLKAWLRAYEAPVATDPIDGGHRPIRLLPDFEAWLIRMEHEWSGWDLADEDAYHGLPWEAQDTTKPQGGDL